MIHFLGNFSHRRLQLAGISINQRHGNTPFTILVQQKQQENIKMADVCDWENLDIVLTIEYYLYMYNNRDLL